MATNAERQAAFRARRRAELDRLRMAAGAPHDAKATAAAPEPLTAPVRPAGPQATEDEWMEWVVRELRRIERRMKADAEHVLQRHQGFNSLLIGLALGGVGRLNAAPSPPPAPKRRRVT